jgi:hypothetical protein
MLTAIRLSIGLVLALSTATTAFAQDNKRRDGNYWVAQSQLAKVSYPREHTAAIGVGQWTEQKVSGKQSRTSANAAISTKNASTALRSERTAMPIAQ